MTEVKFKIHELRDAAEQFKKSGQRMDYSMHLMRGLIEPILPQLQDVEGQRFAHQYYTQRVLIEQWMRHLTTFALKLAQAGDDLEAALYGLPPGKSSPSNKPPAPPLRPLVLPSLEVIYRETVAQREAPTTPASSDALLSQFAQQLPAEDTREPAYLAGVNKPLYEEMLNHERKLEDHKAQLGHLQTQHEYLKQDLNALENRLLSEDPTTTPDKSPYVQALKTRINTLDTHINGLEQEISQMDMEMNRLNIRLERVMPSRAADLLVIAALEAGETPEIIRQNTEGCVNYIVNRMPIPVNIPRDAHLWDNMALQFPEYGVKIGDTPLVGSVIVLEREHSYADDLAGHLMYVERVENGHVWITDDRHPEPVLLSDLTDERSGPHIRFLYFPWHTQA